MVHPPGPWLCMGPRELEDLGYDHAGLEDCGRQALVGQV